MGVKTHKPTTPTMRFQVTYDFEELTARAPTKRLLSPLTQSGGRNAHGHITVRFRGGGHKRMYRRVDFFRRDKAGMTGTVVSVEYDPNRRARISLIRYPDGDERYIIWPDGLRVGQEITAGDEAEITLGSAMALRRLPAGQMIHNIEIQPRRGAQIVRSAGTAAVIQSKEGKYAHVRLPSGEIRLVHLECWATVGQVGNIDRKSLSAGKAGRTRWRGRRPHVRGVAMNPVDHPHGGGEGKAGQGNPHPVSPWSNPRGSIPRKSRIRGNTTLTSFSRK